MRPQRRLPHRSDACSHPVLTRLREFGGTAAIIFHGETFSYGRLVGLIDSWCDRFRAEGIGRGDVVALFADYSPSACAALLALVELEVVVVPVSSSVPEAKAREYLDVAQVEVEVVVAPSDRGAIEWTGRRADHVLYGKLRATGHGGLVLFSSGTTGRSKASLLDFRRILDRYGEPSRPRRTLSFLTIDHIGGINTLLHTFSQGGAIVTVAQRTPATVFEAIAEHDVQVLPTTPTFLNMLLISRAYEHHDTSSLELISYGTEPMPIQTLERLRAALPSVRLKQTYGLSELGILPTRSRGNGTLWVELGTLGFEHKIIDGILWIRSEMAMLGYLNAEAPFDAEGFFNTQDAVETDGRWLHILGRTSEIINVGGEKVYPSEVEGVILEIHDVADVTVSARHSPVTGMLPAATVRLRDADADAVQIEKRIRRHCRDNLEAFKVPALIEFSADVQHSDRFKKRRA